MKEQPIIVVNGVDHVLSAAPMDALACAEEIAVDMEAYEDAAAIRDEIRRRSSWRYRVASTVQSEAFLQGMAEGAYMAGKIVLFVLLSYYLILQIWP